MIYSCSFSCYHWEHIGLSFYVDPWLAFNFSLLFQSFSSEVCSVWTSHSALWGESLLFHIPSEEECQALLSFTLDHMSRWMCLWIGRDGCSLWSGTIWSKLMHCSWDVTSFVQLWNLFFLGQAAFFISCRIMLLLVLRSGEFSILSIDAGGTHECPLCHHLRLTHFNTWRRWILGKINFKCWKM